MSLTVSKLHFTRKTDKTVYVTSALARQLRLRGKRSIQLRLGGRSISTNVRALNRKGKHIYLPYFIKEAIRVPKSGNLYVTTADSGSSVRIGPLVGILTSGGRTGPTRPFGTRTGLMRELIRAGEGKAYTFAFTPQDIDWAQETVLGYFLGLEGEWIRRTVPLPDVVYNRLASRRADASPGMEQLKKRFLRKNIPVFNWSFYNKWDVYRMLEGEEVYKHVPESTINPTPERIQDMLDRHKFIYLKPTGGSLGIGIYRITYHPSKGYFARFRRNGQNKLLRFRKFSSLMHLLGGNNGRLRNYVAQQGVRLVEIDGSPLDFRFHLVRDDDNEWNVAGIGAKKAGKGSVTTHIKNGGTLMTPEYALGRVYGGRAQDVLQKIKDVTIKLAESIQHASKHHVGELGFDMGIDTDEKIWMFEANSKPGRSIYKHSALKEDGRETLAVLFQHCLYLAKFRKRGSST